MGEQPMPKSPPGFTNLYVKTRHQAKLELLEREIGFLQEELKSLEEVQPTSRCCKEINDFISAKPDPFIDVDHKSSPSNRSCSWRKISKCCRSDNENTRQARKKKCCTRENCCPNCCCIKCGSCFPQSCCFLKLCSKDCCKLKLCPNCALNCSSCC